MEEKVIDDSDRSGARGKARVSKVMLIMISSSLEGVRTRYYRTIICNLGECDSAAELRGEKSPTSQHRGLNTVGPKPLSRGKTEDYPRLLTTRRIY